MWCANFYTVCLNWFENKVFYIVLGHQDLLVKITEDWNLTNGKNVIGFEPSTLRFVEWCYSTVQLEYRVLNVLSSETDLDAILPNFAAKHALLFPCFLASAHLLLHQSKQKKSRLSAVALYPTFLRLGSVSKIGRNAAKSVSELSTLRTLYSNNKKTQIIKIISGIYVHVWSIIKYFN